MKVRGLSPESYGTLRALRTRKKLRYFEEQVAAELIAAGFARRNEGLLVATSLTFAKPQTPELPTPKRVI